MRHSDELLQRSTQRYGEQLRITHLAHPKIAREITDVRNLLRRMDLSHSRSNAFVSASFSAGLTRPGSA